MLVFHWRIGYYEIDRNTYVQCGILYNQYEKFHFSITSYSDLGILETKLIKLVDIVWEYDSLSTLS